MNDKKKILVVEDEAELRDLYKLMLENEGYEVAAAADGEEGWEKLRSGGFDLALLDVMLPEKNGMEMLSELNDMGEEGQQILQEIMLLTNWEEAEAKDEALSYGVKDYVMKSECDPDQLMKIVREKLSEV